MAETFPVTNWLATFTDRGTTGLATNNTTTSTHNIFIQPLRDIISGVWTKSGLEAIVSCYAQYTDHASLSNSGIQAFMITGCFDKNKIDIDYDMLIYKLNNNYQFFKLSDTVKIQFKFNIVTDTTTLYSYFTYEIVKIIRSVRSIGELQMSSFDMEDYVLAPIIANLTWYYNGSMTPDPNLPTDSILNNQVITSLSIGFKFAYQKKYATSYATTPVYTVVDGSKPKGTVTFGTKPEITFSAMTIPIMIIPAAFIPNFGNGYAYYNVITPQNIATKTNQGGLSMLQVPGSSTSNNTSDTVNNYNQFTDGCNNIAGDELQTYIPYDPLRSNVVNNIEVSTTQMDLVTSWTYNGFTEKYATTLSPDPDSSSELIYVSDVPQLR